jgi:ATP-binding cassette subfamily B protein
VWLPLIAATLQAALNVAVWLIVADGVDNGIRAGDRDRLYLDAAVFAAVIVVLLACGVYLARALVVLGQSILLELRRDLFRHLTTLSLRYFSEQRAGWIISRLTSDVDTLSEVLSAELGALIWGVFTIGFAIAGLFVLDWRLALVTLIVMPLVAIFGRWFQRRSRVAFGETRTTIAAVTAHLAESVAGMAIVQAFGRERAFREEFDRLNDDNRRANIYAQKLSSIFFPGVELFGMVATACVLLAGAILVGEESLTIGTLIAVIGVVNLLYDPLTQLSELYGQLQSASAAMEKIATVLDTEADVADRPGAREAGRISGAIDLDTVSFAYGDEPTLRDVDVHVPAGGCLALVGESGGGKSTLAKLVARFYDPDGGTVRVDGVDLRDYRLESYRRNLGVVLQDPFLFAGTIASNIRFGQPDATDDEVRAAAAAVGVDRVAARFPDGLDHAVREGGAGLSAGERQLISIARALLADPRILVLDEATSSIDRPTEGLVERALDRLLRGRTSLVVAHRLATVQRADEILVVEHGRVVQRGSARALLAVDGPFRRLATADVAG